MRKCRFCHDEIEDAATVCPHCGKDLIPGRTGGVSAKPAAAATAPPAIFSTTKKCPFCAEEIQAAAIVCKHCGRDLNATPSPVAAAPPVPAVTKPKSIGCLGAIGIVVALIVVLIVISSLFGSSTPSPPKPDYDASSAFYICRQFVEKRLKAPASAKFPYASTATTTDLGAGKFRVLSYVDSQNGFGALIRNTIDCTVHWTSGTSWSLDNLDIASR